MSLHPQRFTSCADLQEYAEMPTGDVAWEADSPLLSKTQGATRGTVTVEDLTQQTPPRLSLCGERMSQEGEQSAEQQKDIFEDALVSFQDFQDNPDILADPQLIAEIGPNRYYPWRIAAPMLMSALCFGRALPTTAIESLMNEGIEQESSGGWLGWLPFRRKATSSPRITPSPSPASPAKVEVPPISSLEPEPIKSSPEPKLYEKPQGMKSLYPTSDQLKAMGFVAGQNTISFTIGRDGGATVDGFAYLWPCDAKIVISDVDGTVTRSDVLGHILPNLGKDWSHAGIAKLFNEITRNGYHLMYLTSRALGQASMTRDYLQWVQQDGLQLPPGPVIMSPDGLIHSLTREVILRRPMDFKIACLRDIAKLFPRGGASPFYAGFGNRDTDFISYSTVGVPDGKIFTINNQGDIQVRNVNNSNTYGSMVEVVDSIFPSVQSWTIDADASVRDGPVVVRVPEQYNTTNFWQAPNPYANVDIDELLDD